MTPHPHVSHLQCSNPNTDCLTRASFDGFPNWHNVRCVNCGGPMRYTGCTPGAILIESPTWRSWTGARWINGPKPKGEESLFEVNQYHLF